LPTSAVVLLRLRRYASIQSSIGLEARKETQNTNTTVNRLVRQASALQLHGS
jgi:hypothetical protein